MITNYYNNIYTYIVRRTGKREIAEDLTQETFLRLVNSIENYKPTGKFKNFIFTIAVNVCNDFYRKNKVSFDDVDIDSLSESDSEDIELANLGNRIVLKNSIDRLPGKQKEVLLLRFFHDMKIKDIAKITDVSIPTVKSRLSQGLGKLRKIIGSEDI